MQSWGFTQIDGSLKTLKTEENVAVRNSAVSATTKQHFKDPGKKRNLSRPRVSIGNRPQLSDL